MCPFDWQPRCVGTCGTCTDKNFAYIIHHTSYIIHHKSYIIHHTSHIIHHTSYIIYHTSYIIHHTSHTIHHASYIIHHTSYIIHHTSHTIRYTSYIIHHTSYIIHHTSYITHHTSYTIHHTSYIIHTLPLRFKFRSAVVCACAVRGIDRLSTALDILRLCVCVREDCAGKKCGDVCVGEATECLRGMESAVCAVCVFVVCVLCVCVLRGGIGIVHGEFARPRPWLLLLCVDECELMLLI